MLIFVLTGYVAYGLQRTFPLSQGKGQGLRTPNLSITRLAAMRVRLAAMRATPDAHAIPAPPTARKTTRISMKYYSKKLAEKDGPSTASNNAPIEIDSDSEEEEPKMDPMDEQHEEADPHDEQEEEEDHKIDRRRVGSGS
ncbi:hypothetical protein PIB30_089923 [Stylosanthes scabra]|uniref:Uncharacterized protein n=1 Tax=Stylosanthes scabra TaxID=79078 RepID=A0ABU6ZSR5_9FABA|nr:hypothetical protein [Stylosanthes scabra]